MSIAKSVADFNSQNESNIARFAASGLSGYEILLWDDAVGVKRPARTFQPSMSKVREQLSQMEKETRKHARVYDLSLRMRVL